MSRVDLASAVCSAALEVTRAEFDAVVGEARKAGYRGLDAVVSAYLAIADPDWGRRSRAGRKPGDAVTSAVWRGSPRRVADGDNRLQSAIRAAGGQWRDGAASVRPKPACRLADAALHDAALALHPGKKSWDREVRRRTRAALAAGQLGFGGSVWGVAS